MGPILTMNNNKGTMKYSTTRTILSENIVFTASGMIKYESVYLVAEEIDRKCTHIFMSSIIYAKIVSVMI